MIHTRAIISLRATERLTGTIAFKITIAINTTKVGTMVAGHSRGIGIITITVTAGRKSADGMIGNVESGCFPGRCA